MTAERIRSCARSSPHSGTRSTRRSTRSTPWSPASATSRATRPKPPPCSRRSRPATSWKLLEGYRALRLYLRERGMQARGLRARAALATRQPRVPHAVRELPLGVNVSGYLSTESGMGEAARASIRSLEASGVPMVLTNVPSCLRTQDLSYTELHRRQPASIQPGASERRQHGCLRRGARAAATSRTATRSATGSGSSRSGATTGSTASTTSMKCGSRASSRARVSPRSRRCPS